MNLLRSALGHSARALFIGACTAAVALGSPSSAFAQAPSSLAAEIADADAPREIRAFYRARGNQPLWIRGGAIGPEAERLLDLIASAELDGLDPGDYRPRDLTRALERAEGGSPRALARAEMALSRSFAQLARDMRAPRDIGMHFADAELRPQAPTMRAMLEQAAAAPSLAAHVDGMGWMNPVYAGLRRAATDQMRYADDATLDLVRANLDRARVLPGAAQPGRYVLVDAAAARLWMYENGRAVGSMRVVVGKPTEPTPIMAGLIRYASVNPYWNLPPDLVRLRVAPGAVEQGPGFLKAKRFEALSDWSDNARVVNPATIDWRAVREGRIDARVRQLPGPNNAMGRIKFMFPNSLGIYLHDTPEKALLREDDRLFSSGCVRLEDAPRLARWLFGKPVSTKATTPEKRVDLAQPVPVYITYLTVAAEGQDMVFRPDVYNRDRVRMAGGDAGRYASR
ncbi:L,D-transpeptidase family protein [Sphingomonas lenta]|uniref:L,D-transpeptidase n=1 Tax=Sphingomonas lenta TaxID=1141887 RepID=A0A2A2SF45_9SPHN|nr:L,D-transpeptidase family protein [Sphingomonas lenta]PAX07886.1 L,D-transpeptidase [Sphingomonas lenta]